MQPKDQQVPVILNNNTSKKKKKQKKVIPPKMTHEIKRPIVTADKVNRYLQHVQNNPDLDDFPMINLMIRTQIVECEVAYYKIRHTNPVLAEVDMEYYHSLPSVQVLLGEMTRLESEAMQLDANHIKITTNTAIPTTVTRTAARPQPKNRTKNTATATTTSTKPTVDQTHHQNRTEKDTAGTPATTNNNKNTTDNQTKADDNHIPDPSDQLLEQQKAAAEAERWHTDRDTIGTTESNNSNNNYNNKTSDNPTKVDDDKRIAKHAQETKRQHKQAIEREQAWHRNNNNRMRYEASKLETEKERERERKHGVDVK